MELMIYAFLAMLCSLVVIRVGGYVQAHALMGVWIFLGVNFSELWEVFVHVLL